LPPGNTTLGHHLADGLLIDSANSLYDGAMRILNFTVVMTPDVDGGYVVTCPALPGLVSEGNTLEEARAMATDAIQGYLESLRKHGEPIPTDESITEQLAVEIV
ncbi:MAG TPA: type II toxin-antitoxin system HicB family antitoxin, partial [Pyrinomonadaceae bacterium]